MVWLSLMIYFKGAGKESTAFVLLNGHYLVVIRYCQSAKGKQRVFNKSFGNKRLQMKSKACVCDCHLLCLSWEKNNVPF